MYTPRPHTVSSCPRQIQVQKFIAVQFAVYVQLTDRQRKKQIVWPLDMRLIFGLSCCDLMTLQTAEGEENEFKDCTKVSEMRQKEINGTLKPEPLLTENPGRFVLFPIQDNEVL